MFISRQDVNALLTPQKLKELTNPQGSSPDENIISNLLSYTNNLISDALRSRYALPLPSIPLVLLDAAKLIFRYKLHERVGQMPENIQTSYDNAIETLNDYSTGKKSIQVTGAIEGKSYYITWSSKNG